MAENWMTDLLANLQGGGAPTAFGPAASPFPDIPQPPFGVPDMNSAGIQLAMNQAPEGTGVPGPAGMAPPVTGGSAPFGIPPSVQLAAKLAAPPQTPPEPPGGPLPPGAVPLPKPRPEEAPAATPTDISAQSRVPAAAPMGLAPPAPNEPSFLQKTGTFAKAIAPALLGVGAALQGDQGHLAATMAAQRDALAMQAENQDLTSRALLKAGASASDVAAAVKNPDLLKALVGKYYAKDDGIKFEKVKDANGNEVGIWVDPKKRTVESANIPGIGDKTEGQNLTANALRKAGAPDELVAAAVKNPEVLKAAIAQYLGKDKFKVVQIGENDRGKKTFQLMNEQDGTFKPIPGGEVAADNATEAAAAAGITGAKFLETVPNAQDRSLIKQLTQYDLDPGKLSAKGGNRERLLALAEQYDPDFKAALYAPRAAVLKEFTSGGANSPASIITNGNTAIQHLGRMSELADKLGGVNRAGILNAPINWANITIEELKNNPDLARFKGAQDRFVEEATKFYRGVGGNKADIDRALHILTAAQSPEARQAAIQEQAELMQSKVNALQDRFKSGMGPSGWKKALSEAGTEFSIVQQHSAEELDKIRKRAAGEKVAPSASAPIAPVTKGTTSSGITWSIH